MEEIRTSPGGHRLVLFDRKNGQITGVRDVVSFDPQEIVLQTELGRLTIRGKELHVGRLNLEKGEVDLDGQIDSMIYTGKEEAPEGESFLKRLLR